MPQNTTPDRPVLRALVTAHRICPELRTGQLLVNVILTSFEGLKNEDAHSALFGIRDDELAKRILAYAFAVEKTARVA